MSYAHPVRDSEEFRAGMAYAAQVILRAIGMEPDADPAGGALAALVDDDVLTTVAMIEPKRCCQHAVITFALGSAAGLKDAASHD